MNKCACKTVNGLIISFFKKAFSKIQVYITDFLCVNLVNVF